MTKLGFTDGNFFVILRPLGQIATQVLDILISGRSVYLWYIWLKSGTLTAIWRAQKRHEKQNESPPASTDIL